jgi:hypothetical protein
VAAKNLRSFGKCVLTAVPAATLCNLERSEFMSISAAIETYNTAAQTQAKISVMATRDS